MQEVLAAQAAHTAPQVSAQQADMDVSTSQGSSGEDVGSEDDEGGAGDDVNDGGGLGVEGRNEEQRRLLALMGRFRVAALQHREQQDAFLQAQSARASSASASSSGDNEQDEDLQEVLAMASAMARRGGSRRRAAAAVKSGKFTGTSSDGEQDGPGSSLSAADRAQSQKRRKVMRTLKAALKPLAVHKLANSS